MKNGSQKVYLRDKVYKKILQDIETGNLKPGDYITEMALNEDYLAYFMHKEWECKDPSFLQAEQYLLKNGDMVTKVKKCPWNSVFKEIDLWVLYGALTYQGRTITLIPNS